jgi:hypothetical protein
MTSGCPAATGGGHFGHQQFQVQPDKDEIEQVGKPWRRYVAAVEAMVAAEEADDFQAVGTRCR